MAKMDSWSELYQLLAPQKIRAKTMQNVHGSLTGHFNEKKPKSKSNIGAIGTIGGRMFCQCCEPCNKFHREVIPKQRKLQDMRVGAPFERLQVNLTGPFPRSEKTNMAYICTTCAFTKFVIAVPIPDKSAISFISCLRKAGDKIFVTYADKLKPVLSICQCYVMLPGVSAVCVPMRLH